MAKTSTDIFRDNVRALMKEHKVSFRMLAGGLNTSAGYLNRLLSGQYDPQMSRVQQIADYFEVPMADLFQKKQRK